MIKSIVNDSVEIQLNSELEDFDILEVSENSFSIIAGQKVYNALVLESDLKTKTFRIQINKQVYDLRLEDEFDELVKKMGFSIQANKIQNDVKSPMSGVVLDILIKVGDEIKKGDSLIILEAMKMENVLKAERDAVVKSISVRKGDTVSKNDILLEFD